MSDYAVDRVVNMVVAVRIRTDNEREFGEQLAEIARNGIGTWAGFGHNGGYSVSHAKPDVATLANIPDPQAFVEAVRKLMDRYDYSTETDPPSMNAIEQIREHLKESPRG